MTHRRLQFSSPRNLLIDSTRLSALKSKVDAIASDLATLDGQSEDQRRDNPTLRDSVIDQFRSLDEV